MRIAQVCQFFYPDATGVTTHIHSLSKHLLARGHSVDIFTPQRGGTPREEILDGVTVHRIPSLWLYPRLLMRLLFGRFDVVHSHSIWQHTPVSMVAARLTGARFVLTTHGTWFHVAPHSLKMKLYSKLIWQRVLKSASAIIIVNEDERAVLRGCGVDDAHIHYVPNAVDTDIFKPVDSEPADCGTILFVGRIQKEKGVFTLLESVPGVVARFPGARFVFVGSGEIDRAMEVARELGIECSVEFAGPIHNSELPRYYSSASVFALPSEYENCAGVYLEAMACRTPVIGTRVGGTKYMIGHGKEGFLIEPGDSKQLEKHLIEMLSRPEMLQDMGYRGRERVLAEFSWQIVADRIEGLYAGLRDGTTG